MSATLRPNGSSASPVTGVTTDSSRPLCYYKPGKPCSESQCRGDPNDCDSSGNLKLDGFVYGGTTVRSELYYQKTAWHYERCPACFRHFHGIARDAGHESSDTKTQVLEGLHTASARHLIDVGTHGNDKSLSSVIGTSITPDQSSAQEEPAPSSTFNPDLLQSTVQPITKVPGLVGPSEFLIETFNKADTTSITSTVNSLYRFYAQTMICDVYLRSSNVPAIEGLRAECDQAYAIHSARELESKLFYLLKMLQDRDEGELFVKCIQLATKHIIAVTKLEKDRAYDAYLLVAVPFFTRLKGAHVSLRLTKDFLSCLDLLKRADNGEAEAQQEWRVATGALLLRLALITPKKQIGSLD